MAGNRRGYQCRRHGLSQQANLYPGTRENPRPTPGSSILAPKGASPKDREYSAVSRSADVTDSYQVELSRHLLWI
jgi:hypothetical protein